MSRVGHRQRQLLREPARMEGSSGPRAGRLPWMDESGFSFAF